jgi:hypothetical protein
VSNGDLTPIGHASIWAAPVGTPAPNVGTTESGLYTVQESGVTNWDFVTCGVVLAAICPECRDAKHGNCIGYALDPVRDEVVACGCTH